MTTFALLLSTLSVPPLLLTSLLLVQVLAAVYGRRAGGTYEQSPRPQIAILLPAHNEAELIGGSIRSIVPQLRAGDRLLVVADNCTDSTSTQAAAAGAEVIERRDTERRGKGYALDAGIRHLESNPPQVVIVIDADCNPSPLAIDVLGRLCQNTGRPVQAKYLMRAPADANASVRFAEFAWLLKNHVRPLGYRHLGLPCHLMGSGMAFSWSTIREAHLASADLVEDMLLGLNLADAGAPPTYCPDAEVTSWFPSDEHGAAAQRQRWEHGHLGLIQGRALAAIVHAAKSRNWQLFALAVDACVPPLALLSLAIAALAAVGVWLLPRSSTLLLTLAPLPLLVLATLLSWHRFGRNVIPLLALAYAPLYSLAKIPMYMRFLIRRQTDWVRTRRGRD